MVNLELIKGIARQSPTKIVLVVIDGLGGLPNPETGKTELETATTPNLDQLAAKGGVPRRAADLKQVLGDLPEQPKMSAFAFPDEAPTAAAPPADSPPEPASRASAPRRPAPRPAPASQGGAAAPQPPPLFGLFLSGVLLPAGSKQHADQHDRHVPYDHDQSE